MLDRRWLAASCVTVSLFALVHCQALLDVDGAPTSETKDAAAAPEDAAPADSESKDVAASEADARVDAGFCAPSLDGGLGVVCENFDSKLGPHWTLPPDEDIRIDTTFGASPPSSLLSDVPANGQCAYAVGTVKADGEHARARLSALVYLDPDHILDESIMLVAATGASGDCATQVRAKWDPTAQSFALSLYGQLSGAQDHATHPAGTVDPKAWTRVAIDADFAASTTDLYIEGQYVATLPKTFTCGAGLVRGGLGFNDACQSTLERAVHFDDVVFEWQ